MVPSKKVLPWLAAAVVIIGGVFVYWVYALKVAHSTFDNYYAFRGCAELIDKTDSYADCRLRDGSTIKIVLIDGKWYLEGDGPGVW